MTIALSENTIGIWFIEFDGDQDWMGHVEKREDEQDYLLTYRHRYYKDDKSFDSEDEKSWYSATAETEEDIFEAINAVMKGATMLFGATGVYKLLKKDMTLDEFMEKFKELPFVHVQEGAVH